MGHRPAPNRDHARRLTTGSTSFFHWGRPAHPTRLPEDPIEISGEGLAYLPERTLFGVPLSIIRRVACVQTHTPLESRPPAQTQTPLE